LPIISSLKSHH